MKCLFDIIEKGGLGMKKHEFPVDFLEGNMLLEYDIPWSKKERNFLKKLEHVGKNVVRLSSVCMGAW